MTEEQLQKLREHVPIWGTLTEEEQQRVAAEIEVCHYRRHDLIHHEGVTPTHVMLLTSGKVKVYKEGAFQKQQIIRLLKPYELFGYRSVLADEPHGSCACALEDSVVYLLNKTCFMALLQNNNAFCFHVMQHMAKSLAKQEIQTINLTQKHIRGRLAEALLTMRNLYGMEDDKVTMAMCMSREDIANMSNMTTSNAIRTLSQFAQEGLISIDGRKIKLLDEEALKKISRLG